MNSQQAVALELIELAKKIVVDELRNGLKVEHKADHTPVTQIDKRINEVALELLGTNFPDDAVYAEEGSGGSAKSGYTWVIDPIDGTQALALGIPTYTVCVSRVSPDGQAEFSFVYNPSLDELYESARGGKALKNKAEIAVKNCSGVLKGSSVYLSSRMPDRTVDAGDLYEKLEDADVTIVNTHAVAHASMLVAEGAIDAAVAGVHEPYELAAVKLIVEAAGGVVSDLDGKPILRCDTKQRGFIAAANEKILRRLVRLCKPAKLPEVQPEHERAIRRYMPTADRIRHAPAGYINDVYIVDEETVFRFPKTTEGREVLQFETTVLQKLEGKVRLHVPRVKFVAPDGQFAEVSYLRGKQLSHEDIAWLNDEQKRSFAEALAGFIKDLNAALPKTWLAAENSKLPMNRKDDFEYYESLLTVGQAKNNQYAREYKAHFDKLMQVRKEVFLEHDQEIVVHGDLHSSNFLFNENDELIAVIDFGECMLHSMYVELRQVYQLGEDVVAMVVDALGGVFGEISFETVRLFAVTHEFSVLMRSSLSEQMPYDKDRAELAKQLLRDWGEL